MSEVEPESLRVSRDGSVADTLHFVHPRCAANGCRPVYVLDIPDVFDGYSEAELFAKNLRKTAHPNSTNGKIAQQIEDQLPKPARPYREHPGNRSAPWPVVPECHSANDDTHECPQCAWEHEHDWVAWVDPAGPEWAPGAVPIRCSKCGGRKCDQDMCPKQRHTHRHDGSGS